MVPPTSQWKKKKTNYIHISEMWKHLELKVRFCTFTAFKVKEDSTEFWNERGYSAMETEDNGSLPTSQVWILAPCQGGHHKIRPKAISPTKTRGFLIQICENPDIISENWPHRNLLRTLMYKTQKDHPQRSYHAPPRAAMNSRWTTASSFKFVQICSEFQKTDHTKRLYGFRSTKPENFRSKTWATRCHAPPEGPAISASTNTPSHVPPS